jgi:hypothetical protein
MKNKIKRHRQKSKMWPPVNHKNQRKRMNSISSSRFRILLKLTGKIPSMIITYSLPIAFLAKIALHRNRARMEQMFLIQTSLLEFDVYARVLP